MATPPTPETELASLYARVGRRIVAMFREVKLRGAEGSVVFIAAQARLLALDLDRLDPATARWLRENVAGQYARSAGQAQLTLNRAGVPIAEAGFTGFDTRAIVALEGRLSGDLSRVRAAIGAGLVLGGPPRDTARAIAAGLEEEGLVQFRRGRPRVRVPSGKFWDVEAYSLMLGRTVVADTRRVAFRERYLSNGIDLVVVVANGTRHPTCAAWEGVTLSLTGSTPGFPTVNDARAAGLFHPQCRHRYVVDTSQPQPEVPTGRVGVPAPEVPLPTLGLQPRTAAPSALSPSRTPPPTPR